MKDGQVCRMRVAPDVKSWWNSCSITGAQMWPSAEPCQEGKTASPEKQKFLRKFPHLFSDFKKK